MTQQSHSPEESQAQVKECGNLVELMIKALVDRPEAVAVQVVSGAQAVIYEVSVDPEDVRRVIGRKGRTADALRELLTNLGSKAGRRYLLEIVEPRTRSDRMMR